MYPDFYLCSYCFAGGLGAREARTSEHKNSGGPCSLTLSFYAQVLGLCFITAPPPPPPPPQSCLASHPHTINNIFIERSKSCHAFLPVGIQIEDLTQGLLQCLVSQLAEIYV